MTDIVKHVTTSQDKMQQAQLLADANLIPRAYQKNPANVFVAIEYGEALGIHPMVAISEINLIQGTPSLSASLMASLARNAGHKVRVYGDAKEATCEIVRADDPDFTHKATWTEAKARAAGLWGKGHWAKDAATMLKWRAISEAVRFACSEVLGGIKYIPDEIHNFNTQAPSQAPAPETPSQPTTIRRKPVDEEITVTEVVEEQPDPENTPAREEQVAALTDWLHDKGIQEPQKWLDEKTGVQGVSPYNLTAAEVDELIKELSA